MKICVFADTHGDSSVMKSAIEKQKPDIVIHCGDGIDDAKAMERAYPDITFHYVRGNCDSPFSGEKELVLEIEGYVFFVAHGDNFEKGFYFEPKLIADYARNKGASIVLHGHTHRGMIDFSQDDIQIFNPGCATPKKAIDNNAGYGIIDIKERNVSFHLEVA